VHVNGYFELSSNRRNIWFSALSSDLAGEGQLRSTWNLALLEVIGLVPADAASDL
jgi:sacsin